jgi:K+-sensing histidine kinase KdpD
MPDRDESTPPPKPPAPTYDEQKAQRELIRAAGRLAAIRAALWNIHVRLGEGPNEDAIAEGEIPETLAFAIRGAIECVNGDDLDPAIHTLEETARLTPSMLLKEWQERVRERAARGETE